MTDKEQKSAEVAPKTATVEQKSTEVQALQRRIAELEAELEAVGAGGVQALSAAPARAGWKWVPVEPTEAMVSAGYEAYGVHDCYAAMLAASPTPPAEQQAAGWHAPGLGEVHSNDHNQMIYCTDGDDVVDDALAKTVCSALNATRQPDATTGAALGGVYAELPDPQYQMGGRGHSDVAMRDFADRTHALRMQAATKAASWMECSSREKLREMHHYLAEAHGFAAMSPRGKDNIAYALEILDELENLTPPHSAPKAAPGEREQAAQRLRELAGIPQNDVTDPFHPRYIEGYKAGRAAGRKRAAPQQEAQEPAPSTEEGATYHLGACIVEGVLYATVMRKEPGRAGAVTVLLSEKIPVDRLHNRDVLVDATPTAAPQPAPAPLSDDAFLQMRNALEAARNGLTWFMEMHPEDCNSSDDEMLAQIDAALAAQGGKV